MPANVHVWLCLYTTWYSIQSMYEMPYSFVYFLKRVQLTATSFDSGKVSLTWPNTTNLTFHVFNKNVHRITSLLNWCHAVDTDQHFNSNLNLNCSIIQALKTYDLYFIMFINHKWYIIYWGPDCPVGGTTWPISPPQPPVSDQSCNHCSH